MKTNYLLPTRYKKAGLVLSIPFAIGCITFMYNNTYWDTPVAPLFDQMGKWEELFDEICVIGLSIGLLFTCFSREKDEDECIGHLRMQSWTLAIVYNYLILIVATLCLYDIKYLNFMYCNLFTIPLIFLAIFHWKLYRFRKEEHE